MPGDFAHALTLQTTLVVVSLVLSLTMETLIRRKPSTAGTDYQNCRVVHLQLRQKLRYRTVKPSASAANGTPNPGGLLVTPEQQVLAYQGLAMVHTALAAVTCFAPSWAIQHMFGWMPTPATAMQLVIAPRAYFWLIVACLVCLKEAAVHNRLNSDTYKRLNLGVMYQCIIFTVLTIRQRSLLTSTTLGLTVAVLAATAFIAGRVYASSTGGFSLPTVVKSFLGNLKDLVQPKTLTSAFYSLCAALALCTFFWQFPTPGTPLFLADEGPVAVLLKQAWGGGMVLVGVVWYTLKDAADRGRLAAATFKQLNLAMSVVAVLQLAAYGRMAAAGVPLMDKLYRTLMGAGLVTVAVCDWQFFMARKKEA